MKDDFTRVLLVEDTLADAQLLTQIQFDAGTFGKFAWESAIRLDEALRLTMTQAFDAILLLVDALNEEGLKALAQFRVQVPYTPILVISERDDPAMALMALRAGAQDCLPRTALTADTLARALFYAIERSALAYRDFSERRREEHALQESEARFKAVVESLPVALVITRLSDAVVLFANDLYCDVIRATPGTVVGKQVYNFFFNQTERETIAQEVRQNGVVIGREVQIRRFDGSVGWILGAVSRITLDGEPALLSGFQDITTAKQLEQELIDSERRFYSLFEHSPIALWVMDYSATRRYLDALRAEGTRDFETYFEQHPQALQECIGGSRVLDVNEAALSLYGAADQVTLVHHIQRPADEQTAVGTRHFLAAIADGQLNYRSELVSQMQDGTPIHLDVTWTVVPGYEETHARIIRSAVDVTERNQSVQALQQFNRRIQVLHNIDRGIMTTQPPKTIAVMIARNLSDMIPCDAIRIIAVDSYDNSLTYFAAYPPTSPRSEELLYEAIVTFGFPESFHQGQALLIDDVETHENFWPGFKELLTRKGARSWIIIPLSTGTKLFGMLAAGASHPHAFTSEHYNICREVADQLAIALYKTDLDKQVQAHAQELEARVAERTEQLRQAKERIETVLTSTSDAIIVARADGALEQVNPAFASLFGYSLEQAASMSILSLVNGDSLDALNRILRTITGGTGAERAELVCMRRDGTTFDADAAFAPVEDGPVLSVICSIRDITLRKQAEKELREALEHEKELGILKLRFVSIVSHEFRTPLASILSSSDLLKHYSDRMTSERRSEHLDRIQAQVKRLTDLLEDTLFLSKSEIVGTQITPSKLNVEAFCRTLVEEFQLTEPARALRFTSTVPGVSLNLDAKLMRQILTNLLSNAVKYSPDDSHVELDLIRQDDHILVRVCDHGVGIPEEDQKHLFEMFHRATNVGTTPGTGVGLTIVKRATEAQGGSILVESTVGQGTVVTLKFPL